MKVYLSKSHAHEDGPLAEEGKLGIIYGTKDDIVKLCDFFAQVKYHVTEHDNCHMHFRDSFETWDKMKHIDIEVNLE